MSWLEVFLGNDPVHQTMKALHILLAGSCLACMVAWAGKVFGDRKQQHLTFEERRFLFWTPMIALFMLWFYVPLFMSYVVDRVQAISTPGLPDSAKLIGLLGLHVCFLGRWAEADPGHFRERFAKGVGASLIAAGLVFVYLPAPSNVILTP